MNHGESFHLKSERRMLFRNIRVTLSRRGGERDKLDEKVRQLKQLQLKSPAPQFILMHLSSAFQSLWGQNTTKLMKNGQPNIFPSKKLPNRDTATLPKENQTILIFFEISLLMFPRKSPCTMHRGGADVCFFRASRLLAIARWRDRPQSSSFDFLNIGGLDSISFTIHVSWRHFMYSRFKELNG